MSAVHRLQRATAAKHVQLEDQLDLLSPNKGADDVAHYVSLLSRVLTDLEAHMLPLVPVLESHGLRPQYALGQARRARDVACLTGLENKTDVPGPADAPWRGWLQHCALPAERFGLLYVLEGSRLGGLQLARHFGRSLGLTDSRGLSYFLQPKTERMAWPAVCQVLTAELANDRQQELACWAACLGFDCFAAALGPLLQTQAKPRVLHAPL